MKLFVLKPVRVSSLELQTFDTITMRDDDSDRGHDSSKPYLGKAYGKLI